MQVAWHAQQPCKLTAASRRAPVGLRAAGSARPCPAKTPCGQDAASSGTGPRLAPPPTERMLSVGRAGPARAACPTCGRVNRACPSGCRRGSAPWGEAAGCSAAVNLQGSRGERRHGLRSQGTADHGTLRFDRSPNRAKDSKSVPGDGFLSAWTATRPPAARGRTRSRLPLVLTRGRRCVRSRRLCTQLCRRPGCAGPGHGPLCPEARSQPSEGLPPGAARLRRPPLMAVSGRGVGPGLSRGGCSVALGPRDEPAPPSPAASPRNGQPSRPRGCNSASTAGRGAFQGADTHPRRADPSSKPRASWAAGASSLRATLNPTRVSQDAPSPRLRRLVLCTTATLAFPGQGPRLLGWLLCPGSSALLAGQWPARPQMLLPPNPEAPTP